MKSSASRSVADCVTETYTSCAKFVVLTWTIVMDEFSRAIFRYKNDINLRNLHTDRTVSYYVPRSTLTVTRRRDWLLDVIDCWTPLAAFTSIPGAISITKKNGTHIRTCNVQRAAKPWAVIWPGLFHIYLIPRDASWDENLAFDCC